MVEPSARWVMMVAVRATGARAAGARAAGARAEAMEVVAAGAGAVVAAAEP